MDFHLSRPQGRIFHARKARRFRVVVAGRRFGKTILALFECIVFGMENPGCEIFYCAPTYRQGKLIAWKILKMLLPDELRAGPPNESELYIELRGGAVIHIKGTDNRDSLRGVKLAFVVLDEFASMLSEVWDEVLRPALADTRGPALFIGSPSGFNHFYDRYMAGLDPDKPEWWAWQFTTAQGGWVSAEELELARRDTDARIFRQEYEASFETLAGRVYWNFDRHVHLDPTLELPAAAPIRVGMDFNVDPMFSCIAYDAGDELHVIDEIAIENSNTQEMCAEIFRRYGAVALTEAERATMMHFAEVENIAPRDWKAREIIAHRDPSGKARKTSAPGGVTDHTLIAEAGFTLDAMNAAPAVIDRVNTVNAKFRDASGRVSIRLHPRCKRLARSLDGQTWKEGTRIPDKTLGLDHPVDALGYAVLGRYGLIGSHTTVERLAI